MNKAVEILEKNVQWMTLGAGVVFVGLMGWRYLLTQPVVEVGGQPLSAGKIDQVIADGPVAALEGKLNGGTPPRLLLPTYDTAFREGMTTGPTTRPLAAAWTTGRGLGIDLPAGTGSSSTRPSFNPSEAPAPGAGGAGMVAKLEALPAATPLGTSQGLSTVNPQAIITAAQAGLQAAQAAAGQPQTPPEGDPGQQLPPGAPPAPVVQGVDREWVTAAFEIDMAGIGQQFQAANIPSGLLTSFLRLEVQREELLADGTYGNPTIINPLANSLQAQNPMPAPGNAQAEAMYLSWAQANQGEILQPGFFSVLSGAGWSVPGQAGGVVGGSGTFDPSRFLTGPIPETLTPEQRELVLQARRDRTRLLEEERRKAAAERRGNRGPGASEGAGGGEGPGIGGGGGSGGGRGGRGGGRYKMPSPQISALPPGSMPGLASLVSHESGSGSTVASVQSAFSIAWATEVLGAELASGLGVSPWGEATGGLATVAQVPPRQPGGFTPPPGMGEPPMGLDVPPQGEGYGMPGAPVINAPNLGVIPSGPFDPQTWVGGKVIAFQHDESVEAGKTYRYRARYVLHNPVFQQPNAVSVPAIAAQFRWESAWSTWTDAAVVPPKVSFFVTRLTSGSAPAAQIEVFRYIRGQMRSKLFAVLPGDVIGSADASGDFSTGHMLVDVRVGGREGFAVVMAPDGSIARRDGSDLRSPKYSQLKAQTTPPATPAAPGTPPPTGGVPPTAIP